MSVYADLGTIKGLSERYFKGNIEARMLKSALFSTMSRSRVESGDENVIYIVDYKLTKGGKTLATDNTAFEGLNKFDRKLTQFTYNKTSKQKSRKEDRVAKNWQKVQGDHLRRKALQYEEEAFEDMFNSIGADIANGVDYSDGTTTFKFQGQVFQNVALPTAPNRNEGVVSAFVDGYTEAVAYKKDAFAGTYEGRFVKKVDTADIIHFSDIKLYNLLAREMLVIQHQSLVSNRQEYFLGGTQGMLITPMGATMYKEPYMIDKVHLITTTKTDGGGYTNFAFESLEGMPLMVNSIDPFNKAKELILMDSSWVYRAYVRNPLKTAIVVAENLYIVSIPDNDTYTGAQRVVVSTTPPFKTNPSISKEDVKSYDEIKQEVDAFNKKNFEEEQKRIQAMFGRTLEGRLAKLEGKK